MAHIIHVGNSLGIRIPKAILQQLGFTEKTSLAFHVTEQGLLIAPDKQVREGWTEQFKTTKKGVPESLLIDDITNAFDRDEWEW